MTANTASNNALKKTALSYKLKNIHEPKWEIKQLLILSPPVFLKKVASHRQIFSVDHHIFFICICIHMRLLVSASSSSVFLFDTF